MGSPTSSPEPQAVLTPLTEASIFLTLVVEPGGEVRVRDLLGDVAGLRRSVGFRLPGNLWFVPTADFLDDPPVPGGGSLR